MHESGKTLRQAAIELLQELGPTHYRKLTDEILSRGLARISHTGKRRTAEGVVRRGWSRRSGVNRGEVRKTGVRREVS